LKKPVQPQEGKVQLLTINEVAERLHVNRATVYDFINQAGLRVTRLARKAVRIDEADLNGWIEQKKAAS
jgi:excisionase family DNA binding protein